MMKQARLDHEAMKETFDLHDMIVLGIYNEAGIFNVQTVERILAVTEEIKNIEGVLYEDIMAIGEVDDIASEENIIRVYPLAELVENGNEEAAHRVKERIDANPIFKNKLASLDGMLIGIYVPIVEKSMSYTISKQIEAIADSHLENEHYYLAGLPLAEDTFGFEMFK